MQAMAKTKNSESTIVEREETYNCFQLKDS